MPTLIEILVNALLPVAVDAAKQKLTAASVPTTVITPQALAIQNVVVGAVSSKTMWFSLILAVLGILEQYQSVVSNYIGADKMGVFMAIVGAITMILRGTTDSSIAEKGEASTSTLGIPQIKG